MIPRSPAETPELRDMRERMELEKILSLPEDRWMWNDARIRYFLFTSDVTTDEQRVVLCEMYRSIH